MTETVRPHLTFRALSRLAVVLLALVAAGTMLAAGTATAKRVKPERIVSLTPFGTDALQRLGRRPVAIGQTPSESEQGGKPFPGVRRLPLRHPYGPNLEQLARYRPTLIISSKRWRKGKRAMEQLGAKVMEADPDRIEKVPNQFLKIGKRKEVNRRARARRITRTLKKQVLQVKRNHKRLQIKVLGILGVGRNPQVFLKKSWGGQIVKWAGGTPLSGGANPSMEFAPLSFEAVIAENPKVIIVVPHGTVDNIGDAIDYIRENTALAGVDAVKNGMVKGSFDNRLLQANTRFMQTIRMIRRCIRSPRAQVECR